MQLVSTTGILLDNRQDEEKSKDYLHEEIASGFEDYVWEERPAKPQYYFPYNQSSSLSCVAGGGAIVLEHFDGGVISRKDIYNRRVNYPQGGMFLDDVCKLIVKGACEEKLVPSQGLGENQMNARYPVTQEIIKSRAKKKVSHTIYIKNNIDELAQATTVCPIIAFWYFDENGKEWWRPYPETLYNFKSHVDKGVTRHQVAIVDAILIDGKKYLVGQDTAGVGTGGGTHGNLRFISEDVVSKRFYAGSYAIDDEDEVLKPDVLEKPRYFNTKTLKSGSTGIEVKMLQAVLIYEGLLKIKAPTGFLGGMTRKAIIDLQMKYRDEILKPAGLKSPTGVVGSLTNLFLNTKYK